MEWHAILQILTITCDDAAPALLEAVRPYILMSKLWVADTDEHWLGALK